MRSIDFTGQFKKDLKKAIKRNLPEELLFEVVKMLAEDVELPTKYHDHPLIGDYIGCRECHIQPDWLLVYRKTEDGLLLILFRTGTHSDLF